MTTSILLLNQLYQDYFLKNIGQVKEHDIFLERYLVEHNCTFKGVAIVDWVNVSTYSEFELHQKYFRENGIETIIATPQEFSIQNGKALAGGLENFFHMSWECSWRIFC